MGQRAPLRHEATKVGERRGPLLPICLARRRRVHHSVFPPADDVEAVVLLTPSTKSSKLTALTSAPAPTASTSPISRAGHDRARPSSIPSTSDEAATGYEGESVSVPA